MISAGADRTVAGIATIGEPRTSFAGGVEEQNAA
jgi:hypothetical protein